MPGVAVDFWARTKPPLGLPLDLTADLARAINGYWLLTEGAGIPRDLVTGTRVAKSGTPVWKGSGWGTVYDLSAGSTSVQLAPTKRLAGSPNFTILLWGSTKATSDAAGHQLYSERGTTGNAIIDLDSCATGATATTDRLFVTYRDDAGTLTQSSTAAHCSITKVNDGIIRQMGMVKRGSVLEVWVNGVLEGSITRSSGTDTLTSATLQTRLGSDIGNAGGEWDGVFLQGITWTRALQRAEIQHLAEQPYALFQPPLWRRYYIVPTLPLATLTDTFDDNATDATLWTSSGSVAETSQRLETTIAIGATFSYPEYLSAKRFDLTGSYALAKLVSAGANDNNTYARFQLGFGLDIDANRAYFQVVPRAAGGGDLNAVYVLAGSFTFLSTVTYVPATHVWFRIRESGGTLFWDTSANGSTWTNLTSVANPFTTPDKTIRSTDAVVGGGADGTAAIATTTIIWDQFNVPDQAIGAVGIGPVERFGSPALGLNLAPAGIGTEERPGLPALSPVITSTGLDSAERFGVVTVAGTAALLIAALGIGSEERAGAVALGLNLTSTALASAERPGAPSVGFTLLPTGLTSAEQLGAPAVLLNLAPLGLASAERFGSPALGFTLQPAGLDSAERFGLAALSPLLQALGIGSEERPGQPALTPGPVTISAVALPSAEALGLAALGLTLQSTALPSAEQVGLSALGLSLTATSLTTAERFGALATSLSLAPVGLESAERFGSVAAGLNLVGAAIGSAEQPGAVTLTIFVGISATGIASAERFGQSSLSPGPVTIAPSGIPSAEQLGPVAAALNLAPAGLASQERAGAVALSFTLAPAGLESVERPGVIATALNLAPAGLASLEQLGDVVTALNLLATALGSAERLGTPATSFLLLPAGIESAERLGSPLVVPGPVTLALTGIASAEALGLAVVEALRLYAILTAPLGGSAAVSRVGGLLVVSRQPGQPAGSATDLSGPSDRTGGETDPSRKEGHYP